MKKERGMKTALLIIAFVSTMAYGSGYLLNKFILMTGIL